MQIIKDTNGFPYAWKAGRVEKLIRSMLETKAQEQLNVDRVMFINPTWMHESNIAQSIVDCNPDFIICHNFVDPAIPRIFEAIEKSGRPYLILGNADQYRIDFWAMVCDLFFKDYTELDVALKQDARRFICLNRKPHWHRVQLVNQLLPYKDWGHISLGLPENPIMLDERYSENQGIFDEYGNLGVDESIVSKEIRNDIFSVGSLDIWNRSLLCLVTETEFSNPNPDNFFISEKTWKPIIGMRPFMVYGQPPMRRYLKDNGFDTFEDIFDYSRIDESRGHPQLMEDYAKIAIDAIKAMDNPYGAWFGLFGRCQANKNRFRTYVYEQWNRLHTLDLRNYL